MDITIPKRPDSRKWRAPYKSIERKPLTIKDKIQTQHQIKQQETHIHQRKHTTITEYQLHPHETSFTSEESPEKLLPSPESGDHPPRHSQDSSPQSKTNDYSLIDNANTTPRSAYPSNSQQQHHYKDNYQTKIPNQQNPQANIIKHKKNPNRPPNTSIQHTLHNTNRTTLTSHQDVYGDYPNIPKNKDTFRLLYSNINGIPVNNLEQESHQLGFHADAHQLDFLGLVETNINWTNQTLSSTFRSIMKKYWPKTTIATSNMITSYSTKYQPGGTMSLLGNNWAGGASAFSDPSGMGRWSEIRIKGRQQQQIIFLTVYRVTQTTIQKAGPTTSYFKQWHHLRRNGKENPNPREQIWQDLSQHIHQHKKETNAIMIMIDANETITSKYSTLSQWVQQHDLIDLHTYLHDIDHKVPTYNRGTTRIDYIFGTPNIIPYVTKGGILPFNFLIATDHRSIYVDIALQRYLRCQPPINNIMGPRDLTSNNPRSINKYCTHLHQWLQENDIEDTLKTIHSQQSKSQITINGVTSLLK